MAINPTPHPTFEQLPDDKRQRFIDAALKEFGQNPYRSASVSAIVSELGIAKGSFYQYFENKAGLYVWLLGQMAAAKATRLDDVDDQRFFDFVRANFIAGLNFWNEQPAWAQLAVQLLHSTGDQEIDNYLEAMRRSSTTWWSDLLAKAQAEGDVRADLDPAVVAPLVNAMLSTGLRDVYQATADTTGRPGIDGDVVRSLANEAIDLLARGLEAAP